jgi:hypothetical protein
MLLLTATLPPVTAYVALPQQKPPSPDISELEVGQKQAILFQHIQPMRVNNHLTRFLLLGLLSASNLCSMTPGVLGGGLDT